MKQKPKRPDSRVDATVRALVRLSSDAAEGAYLGAEDELLAHLGISRPTLRQAAKIVESDRMISVRRGLHGGFYAARPQAADVIRAPARYLRLNGATIADVHAVTRLITEEVVVAATACPDPALRAELLAFRDHIDDADTPAALVEAETALSRLLARMSANPAAQLFMEIAYTFGRADDRVRFYDLPADRERTRALQRGMCDAVLASDREVARLMMQRRSAMVAGWLDIQARAAAA